MGAVIAQASFTKEQFLESLNQGSQEHISELSGFEIADFQLPVETIRNIKFENVEWSNIDASNKHFIDVTFEDCRLKNINMRNAQFENVKFKNCELINVVMNQSIIDTFIFENSKIISTDNNIDNSYTDLKATKLIFINSELNNLNFFESKAEFIFESTTLIDVSGYGLLTGSSITMADSKAIGMDFSVSDLLFVDIKDSIIKESKINDSSIGKVILEGNTFKRFPIASKKTYGTIKASRNSNLAVRGTGPVKEVYISECVTKSDIYLSKMEFENIKIENCKVKEVTFFDAIGKIMVISHVITDKLDLEDAVIDTLILKDVRIRGKIYMQNAKVKNYQAINVIVDEGVRNKDKGANFKIETTH